MIQTTATAGVSNPVLASLLQEHWDATMRRWPTWATQLGDRRFDDQLEESGPDAWQAMREGLDYWIGKVEEIDPNDLDPQDRLTRDVLLSIFVGERDKSICFNEQWSLSPRTNAFSRLVRLPEEHPIDSVQDGHNLIERYKAIPMVIENDIANLRLGIEAGRVNTRESTRRTLELISSALTQPESEWTLLRPTKEEHPTWNTADLESFRTTLRQVTTELVWPAFQAYRDFIETEMLPAARPPEQAGTLHLPNGPECYQALISHHTSLRLDATTIHQIGLDELASIHDEFSSLGASLWDVSEVQDIFHRLRTDERLHFDTAEEIHQKAEESLEKARNAMPRAFGVLPQAACVVTPIPAHEAPYTTIAYYRPPTANLERPGQYFINLYDPKSRPRHEAEALAFHESIPGHHLQLSLAMEQGDLPAFRRHFRSTAYTEGWALYTERLADELGLYSGDIDRLGMLSFDAWRASRLVVDTGIHAMGWTREQAIEFMRINTPLAMNNIENEVDRYISWPGQALAYKLGQIELFRLRQEAQDRLGDQFVLSAWHDEVLRVGAIPLPVLRQHLDRWMNQ